MTALSRLTAALAALCLLAGCNDFHPLAALAPPQIVFYPPVPALPPPGARPPAPAADAVWIPAGYEWNGKTYDLQPGRWVSPAQPDQLWQAGHWIPVENSATKYQWIKGQWVSM